MEAVKEKVELRRYSEYKDSGIEWLGEIPENWKVLPGFAFLRERSEKNTGMKESQVLSLSYGNVIVKPEEKLTGLVPESFETYQLVYPGDIIIRPTDLQNDKTSFRTGIAKDKGIITSAYLNLSVNGANSNKYYHYLLHAIDTNKVIYGLGSGLRQNLSYEDFKRFSFPVPTPQEQTAIAKFLDRKTEQIDQAIEIKQKQIELLKERRQILIDKAVTRGLNPDAPLKPSGVDWIGDIPEHWEVKKVKFVTNLISIKTSGAESELEYIGMENVESWTGNYVETDSEAEGAANVFQRGDILFGKLRPYLAKVYLAKEKGICSTEFLVFRTKGNVFNHYLKQFMISYGFISLINSSTYGAKMPRANSDFIGNQLMIIPPIAEQKDICEFINSINKKIDRIVDSKKLEIKRLKEYKTTLINSAVTGKIKVS
jgi:type I restriction enzyme, S subunit